VAGLNGDDGDEASSLRTKPGRKGDDVHLMSSHSSNQQVGACLIFKGNERENTQVKVRGKLEYNDVLQGRSVQLAASQERSMYLWRLEV
jgi:hypothetical protein